MSKQYNIRWKQSDNDELKKAVKNFNAKISRLEKKYAKEYPNDPYKKYALPERVSVKEMKELIKTRQDYKKELNALRRFSKRGAEELVKTPILENTTEITKWQLTEMNRRKGIINRERKKQYDFLFDLEVTDRGSPLGYTLGDIGMGEVDKISLSPINAFYKSMTRSGVHKRFKTLKTESQTSYWREKEMALKNNIIKGLEAHYKGLFPDDTKRLVDAIENMSFDEFYKTFKQESGVMETISPPEGSNMEDILALNIEALKSVWLPNK